MQTLLDHSAIAPWAQTGVILIGAGILIYRTYLRRIRYQHLYDRRKLQIDRITEYLNSPTPLDPALKEILVLERNDQVFALIFGFSLDAARSNSLLPVVSAQDYPMGWNGVKDARSYIRMDGGKLVVRYSSFDRWEHRIKSVLALFMYMFGAVLTILSVSVDDATTAERAALALTSLVLIAFSALIAFSTLGFSAALRLQKWLKLNQLNGPASQLPGHVTS